MKVLGDNQKASCVMHEYQTMKAYFMETTPAIVITPHHLIELMENAATNAANKALAAAEEALHYDPDARVVDLLRRYLDDRTTLENPREHWAHGKHNRALHKTGAGKPRSVTWFQSFKKESGLGGCPSRISSQHGRLREWCFEDIANAWDQHYVLR